MRDIPHNKTQSRSQERLFLSETAFKIKNTATFYFPALCSIIDAKELDFRVRNGNGYCLFTMVTAIKNVHERKKNVKGFCEKKIAGRRTAPLD